MAAASPEMDPELKKILSWEIENFSVRKDTVTSDPFSSGGCKWCVTVYRKGDSGREDMSLFLHDSNTKSLIPGWKRRVKFCFVLLNQSGKELYRSPPDQGRCILLCAEVPGWGYRPKLTLQKKGLLENNKLTIQVYIKVFEVVHHGQSTENDLFDYGGVQIIASQVATVDKILREHPGFSIDFIRKNGVVKTAYLKKLVVGLIQTLSKSPQSLYVTELSNAQSELTELTEAGFKLDWLKSKLERKKTLSDGSWFQQLVKNVELALSDLKVELDKRKIKSAAGAKVSSYKFIDFLINRFFLSCYSISKH